MEEGLRHGVASPWKGRLLSLSCETGDQMDCRLPKVVGPWELALFQRGDKLDQALNVKPYAGHDTDYMCIGIAGPLGVSIGVVIII